LKELLDDEAKLMINWRSLYVDLVQGGIQDLFVMLNDRFLAMCTSSHDNYKQEGVNDDNRRKLPASSGLVLVLARFSVYVEQFAVPKITEVPLHGSIKAGLCFVLDEFS
jgi:hypothetical protein